MDNLAKPIEPTKSAQTENAHLNISFIDTLRSDYNSALSAMENEVKHLVQVGREAEALRLFTSKVSKIIEISETLTPFYVMFFRGATVLERFGSERLKQLGSDLLPIREVLKDAGTQEEVEEHVLRGLRKQGYTKSHWWIKEVLVVEIEYMLDTLKILIEPDFLPVSDAQVGEGKPEDKPDRYIPPDVKLAVWRRDEGKCASCGAKEKLEYDHIIPVTKGGSNTERNIQLLCQKCNREKSAKIA